MGLLAILVVPGAILSQANAVADNTQIIQQILNIVKDVQTKLNALVSGSTTNTNNIINAIGDVQDDVGDAKQT